MTGAFEYNPAVLPQQIQMVAQTSHTLDDIEARAMQALAATEEFWNSQGSTAYKDAQMIISQGIQEGREVLQHQAHTTDGSHQNTISTDMAAANSIGAF
ncbi:MAG: WXG100 family type VII secretion target [Mycolicibacterium sp.]|uniref:WXG100 family type VII secretion target n=1 Tax=Mycolicibacterium sp. TaxID=2320850 RepID=UPI003D127367